MAQTPPFEIPQQLRELAEKNVEQARSAYGQFMDAMVQATGMWMGAMPSNEMTSGFKVVQDRAVRFAKQNAEACFALASAKQASAFCLAKRTARSWTTLKPDVISFAGIAPIHMPVACTMASMNWP